MKYDLKTPCKNCPFRTDETAIRFACGERAENIAEQAYRSGFPCHLSAEFYEDEIGDGENSGYYAGDNSQHCAGALIMFINDGHISTPGTDNNEALFTRIMNRLDFNSPVFKTEQAFIEANIRQRK